MLEVSTCGDTEGSKHGTKVNWQDGVDHLLYHVYDHVWATLLNQPCKEGNCPEVAGVWAEKSQHPFVCRYAGCLVAGAAGPKQ